MTDLAERIEAIGRIISNELIDYGLATVEQGTDVVLFRIAGYTYIITTLAITNSVVSNAVWARLVINGFKRWVDG